MFNPEAVTPISTVDPAFTWYRPNRDQVNDRAGAHACRGAEGVFFPMTMASPEGMLIEVTPMQASAAKC